MLIYHQLGRVAFTWWQYSLEMLTMSPTKRCLEITHLKSQSHLTWIKRIYPTSSPVQTIPCRDKKPRPSYLNNKSGLNAEILSAALDQYAAQNSKYARPPNPITTPNPKGLLPVAHSIWSHHETFTLWNSLCQGAVPMAVLWIGPLPPNSFNSPNFQTSWSH